MKRKGRRGLYKKESGSNATGGVARGDVYKTTFPHKGGRASKNGPSWAARRFPSWGVAPAYRRAKVGGRGTALAAEHLQGLPTDLQ